MPETSGDHLHLYFSLNTKMSFIVLEKGIFLDDL